MVYKTNGSCWRAETDRSVDDGTLAREQCGGGVEGREWTCMAGRGRYLMLPERKCGWQAGRCRVVLQRSREGAGGRKGMESLAKGRQGNGSSLDVGSSRACGRNDFEPRSISSLGHMTQPCTFLPLRDTQTNTYSTSPPSYLLVLQDAIIVRIIVKRSTSEHGQPSNDNRSTPQLRGFPCLQRLCISRFRRSPSQQLPRPGR